MFKREMRMEVKSCEVVDVVRLLGKFGLKFEFTNEYRRGDTLSSNGQNWFRRFTVYGTKKKLKAFVEARQVIYNYRLH